MSETTGIAWTDHTFNIAWGCMKVSPGCANCYAENLSGVYGFDVWGPSKPRRVFGEKYWANPIKWNAAAEKAHTRRRVFCSSMADVFEDHPTIDAERAKLWPLIERTPWLDWQILTKRAERMAELAPRVPLANVWMGVSAEDQQRADERIPHLLHTPAAIRFVSYEPALGPIDFDSTHESDPCSSNYLLPLTGVEPEVPGLDWVIAGGESGPGYRHCEIAWIESVVLQCRNAGVALFVKQDSGPQPGRQGRIPDSLCSKEFPNQRTDSTKAAR